MVSIIVGYRYLELRWIWFLHSHTVTCRVDENACLQWLLAGAWNFASLSSLCIVCEWGRAKNMCQNLIDSDVVQKWERRKTDRCAWKIRCRCPSDEDLECFVFSRTLSKGDGYSTTEISSGFMQQRGSFRMHMWINPTTWSQYGGRWIAFGSFLIYISIANIQPLSQSGVAGRLTDAYDYLVHGEV